MLFNTLGNKKTQIVIIQDLSNINTTLDFQVEIASAGSLNIRTCKSHQELVTMNFELKCLLNFLDIWKKIIKKNQLILRKGKNIKNHISWQKNQCPRKKSEREVCLLFWLEICSVIGAYFIQILVLKFQLRFLESYFFSFFYSTLEPF